MSITKTEEISRALLADFDPSVIETKEGKRYIGHEVIRMRVIEATGNVFDWLVDSTEYRDDGAIKERKDRNTGEILGTPKICVCRGTLTIPGLGSRTGVGVQVIEFGAGEDAPYKGAESDAFKRAAMAFGVGLQLYTNAPAIAPQPRQTNGTPPVAVPAAISTGELTDEAFIAAYISARDGRRRAELTALMDRPDTDANRWIGMVHSSQNLKHLEYVIGEMTDRQIPSNPKFERAVSERRANLAGIEVPA